MKYYYCWSSLADCFLVVKGREDLKNGLIIARVDDEKEAALIALAVNACHSINPDNPQAVAEGIGDMWAVLEAWKKAKYLSDEARWTIDNQKIKEAHEAMFRAEIMRDAVLHEAGG